MFFLLFSFIGTMYFSQKHIKVSMQRGKLKYSPTSTGKFLPTYQAKKFLIKKLFRGFSLENLQ